MEETLLVTGASGYIAGRLIPALKDLGYVLIGVDRQGQGPPELDHFVQGDLVNSKFCAQVVEGVHGILHLAAAKGDWGISREEYYRDNVEATRALIEAAEKAGVRDWVFYSTVSTLGPHHVPVDEDANFNPIGPYGASKAEAERLFLDLADRNPKARILILRPSVVYGPGNPGSTNVYRLIDAIYNRRFAMVGSGDTIKSTSYIENLVAATLFLMDRMNEGIETYIYVDEPALTTGELVERIYHLLGRTPPSWHIPLSIAEPLAYISDLTASVTGLDLPITAARIAKFNRSTHFDAGKIRDAGFDQPVSNATALRKTVRWHLEHEYNKSLPVDQ